MRVSTVYKHVKGIYLYNNGATVIYGKEIEENKLITGLSIDTHANIEPAKDGISFTFPTPAVCQLYEEGLLECKKSI